MKKTLLLLLLLFTGIMQAQIVNIPDEDFKDYLLYLSGSQTINTNNDGEIQVSEALAVQQLTIYDEDGLFSSLEGIEAFSNLSSLSITSSVTNINLSGMSQLVNLFLDCSNLSELDMTGLQNLGHLTIYNAPITSLDFSGLPNLVEISLSLDSITSLIIGDNINLYAFEIHSNSLQELDLSSCPNITMVGVTLNTENHHVFINLKNGNSYYEPNSSALYNYTLGEGQYKFFVCLDEGEMENIAYIDANAIITNYCTFTPGGNYNVITGSLLFDNEADGCDTNDTVISNIKLNINDGTESGSTISSTGLYSFYTQTGTFTVTPDFENDLFTITPPFAEINFIEVDSLVTTQNFCLMPNGNHPDLDIVIVPFGARPGFDADYKIIYRNKGNQTLSGNIVFTYQEDELDFVSANPLQDASASGSLTWDYNDLAPFQQREIFVTLNVNGPMETPPVNIDDNLQFTATINPVTGDDTPLDNVFGIKETVIGSFDPNDITCLEGRSVSPDMIGEYLHYNINFENTGTAPATFVVIKNVIDTSQFDITSFGMLGASHPVNATITGNKVEFYFNNINLGPLGKGNVVFRIKTLSTLQANDDVTQQANIYFDYNWPIQTNDATTVFEVLNSGEFERDYTIKVYPNPSDGIVNISAASEIKSFELYDVQGRLLQAGTNASLDTSGRAAGMYFVRVFTEEGMKVEKVFKK
ncbi:T9SS type A sorting domain-containing protein [Flavobacterium sp. MFBS3-15]|uniref:T9SS type A sorting domain-containing protein n=1 Tax=Flavobacterium sp. MFBS3-15 TaxID=2989816 RepID=UPI002235B30C|nr:T9SS type A sorting domain-containing protein [Flavobacterium sp. MFBS3-15]MCW4469511.1 T9SS type A sorting domain-containing protein [Flavobacterium sp. MFBS3-15]